MNKIKKCHAKKNLESDNNKNVLNVTRNSIQRRNDS